MRITLLCAMTLLVFSTSVLADVTTTHGDLKLIHARGTQTPQKVSIAILEPAQGQVVPGPDVSMKFQARNWTAENNGKHYHILLDNNPAEHHYDEGHFVFRNVSPGAHVIRIFPVYPWHESVKQQTAIAIVGFYVKEKSGSFPVDVSKPMMIYSTPTGEQGSNDKLPGQPHPGILVDWFLHGVSMGSRAGYYVRISVDGKELMAMKEWRPHYIQGLKSGQHRIKLELLKNGSSLTENFNTTERIITVR